MRLLLFNLATDADDPILGFTTRWIWALAERVEFIHVITMRVGRLEMPSNVLVHSLCKEQGYSEPRRVWEFYKILGRILRRDRVDVCFSHMNPLFTVLGGPVLKVRRIPIITWYAHPKLTQTLKIAHRLSDRMVASVPTAYPYNHGKFTSIGQGIDTDLFSADGQSLPEDPPIIICVGRLSPIKDHPTLLKAAWLLRGRGSSRFRLAIVGGPASSRDKSYTRLLHEQVNELRLNDIVYFKPPVTMQTLPSWYRRCTVAVNMTPTGFGDKVAWEAMACGRPCLVANEGFRETLGSYANEMLYTYRDAERLAERLEWILSLSQEDRLEMGMYLRGRVQSMHGLNRLANELVNIFELVNSSNGTRSCTKTTAHR